MARWLIVEIEPTLQRSAARATTWAGGPSSPAGPAGACWPWIDSARGIFQLIGSSTKLETPGPSHVPGRNPPSGRWRGLDHLTSMLRRLVVAHQPSTTVARLCCIRCLTSPSGGAFAIHQGSAAAPSLLARRHSSRHSSWHWPLRTAASEGPINRHQGLGAARPPPPTALRPLAFWPISDQPTKAGGRGQCPQQRHLQ